MTRAGELAEELSHAVQFASIYGGPVNAMRDAAALLIAQARRIEKLEAVREAAEDVLEQVDPEVGSCLLCGGYSREEHELCAARTLGQTLRAAKE